MEDTYRQEKESRDHNKSVTINKEELYNSDHDDEEGYLKDRKLGEGTYAVVYLGKQKITGRKVAIKKIKVQEMQNGLDISSIREIKCLKELSHPNIIELIEVYMHKTSLNLILEYLESDLEQVIKDKNLVFMPSDIKSWMLMTLRGLEFCHDNNILHRDLKPNNLLLASDGVLKLADFGLAREFGEPYPMTSQVVTSWYRAPELYYGATSYGTGIDMWSVGCIFAELMLRTPFLPGESELQQLDTIYSALGTPTDEDWPGRTQLKHYLKHEPIQKTPFKMIFKAATNEALDLMESMFLFDPMKRITATEAISHPYFQLEPHPTAPELLPKLTKAPTKQEKE
ncbi:CMGC/CDK/CDK7 protein kinase [Neoconidiobolus thromboides FSU 785]|nr:CMGC/CDK/CDK7 protein kinase [Neoconidiobolus thromboides FSU 785]